MPADPILVRRTAARAIRPDAVMAVSAWADRHRILPKRSSAEPGRWRTDRTPYLREILDCLSVDSQIQNVILEKGAQLGGSEIALCWLGYIIDHAPGPCLLVQPTVDLAKRFSRQRIEPLIAATPRLRAKVAPARQRDSGNTVLSKLYPGGQLVITGANSAVGLRSMPAQFVILDEIDGYPLNVNDEGSPLALVEARQRTFARRKRLIISTPTVAGYSAIEAAYLASDQRRYFVPCPFCHLMQPLEFPRLTWSKLGLRPEEAVYICAGCERPIAESHKTGMLEAGVWTPTVHDFPDPTTRGYHLSALYSPAGWMSWGQIARQWTDSQKDPVRLRTFVNVVLGESWREQGEAPAWELLMRRRGGYEEGTCPAGVCFLTCGVDVGKVRLIAEVVGWGRGRQSWSITWCELEGDTQDLGPTGPWAQLANLLAQSFPHELGGALPIRMTAIDSGHATNTVYDFVRAHPQRMAIKGIGGGFGQILGTPTVIDVSDRGRTIKVRAVKVWPVGDAVSKEEFYGALRQEPPTDGSDAPPGACYFPSEYDAVYFKGITAEELVEHTSRIHRNAPPRREWSVIPGRENHLLDARRYARAAATRLGMDRMTPEKWAIEADNVARRANT